MFDEKNQSKKSRETVPLSNPPPPIPELRYRLCPTVWDIAIVQSGECSFYSRNTVQLSWLERSLWSVYTYMYGWTSRGQAMAPFWSLAGLV
jgi:hypothetical protein